MQRLVQLLFCGCLLRGLLLTAVQGEFSVTAPASGNLLVGRSFRNPTFYRACAQLDEFF